MKYGGVFVMGNVKMWPTVTAKIIKQLNMNMIDNLPFTNTILREIKQLWKVTISQNYSKEVPIACQNIICKM